MIPKIIVIFDNTEWEWYTLPFKTGILKMLFISNELP